MVQLEGSKMGSTSSSEQETPKTPDAKVRSAIKGLRRRSKSEIYLQKNADFLLHGAV